MNLVPIRESKFLSNGTPANSEGKPVLIVVSRTSLEMHWVHWNTAYGSYENATTARDGLAVIGFLFNASEKIPKDSKYTNLTVLLLYCSFN